MSILKNLDSIKAKKNLATHKEKTKSAIKAHNIIVADFQTPTAKNSKKVAENVLSTMFDNTGVAQSSRGARLKKKREKAKARAKKNGIPLAPNGEAYDMNDIQYLLDQKYTKEDAIAELSKQEKYTKTILEAPNGLMYEENDIKYLTDKGYKREEAIAELAKCPKYKKMTPGDIKAANKAEIKRLSEKLVGDQVDKMLSVQIDQIAAQYGIKTKWDKETKDKVKDIIRGNCNVVFANDKIIGYAQKATEKQLNEFFDEQLKGAVNDGYSTTQAAMDDAIASINKWDKKRQALNVAQVSSFLTTGIDKILSNTNPVEKAAGKLEKLDNMGEKYGVDLGLQKEMFGVVGKISSSIGSSLGKSLQPKITKEVKIVSSVTARIKVYQDKLKKQQEKVQARLDEWKKQAQEKIKAQEQKLINSALGSLKSGIQTMKIKF